MIVSNLGNITSLTWKCQRDMLGSSRITACDDIGHGQTRLI